MGLINHYYCYRLRDEVGASGLHSALARFAAGDAGLPGGRIGAGELKSASTRPRPRFLVQFLVSAAGQHVLAGSDSLEYPLGSGVANPALPPPSSCKPHATSAGPDR